MAGAGQVGLDVNVHCCGGDAEMQKAICIVSVLYGWVI